MAKMTKTQEKNLKKGMNAFKDKKLARKAQKKGTKRKREKKAIKQLIQEMFHSQAPKETVKKLRKAFPGLPRGATNDIAAIYKIMETAQEGEHKALKTLCEIGGMIDQKFIIKASHSDILEAVGEVEDEPKVAKD